MFTGVTPQLPREAHRAGGGPGEREDGRAARHGPHGAGQCADEAGHREALLRLRGSQDLRVPAQHPRPARV